MLDAPVAFMWNVILYILFLVKQVLKLNNV